MAPRPPAANPRAAGPSPRAGAVGEGRRQSPQEVLAGSAWFAELAEPSRQAFLAAAQERSFRAGEVIAREGAPAAGVHVLLSGRVRLARSVGPSQQALMVVAAPGFLSGLYAALTGRAECVTAEAEVACRTLWVPQDAFARITADAPALRTFMHLLCDRYELLMIAYAASQRSATEEWLRIRLNTLAQLQRGSTQDDPSTIALPQAELADILGVSRQTLNGLLNRLAARGELEVGYRRIRLLG